MNFDEAIKAHAAWKQKLTAYIAKPDKSLDPNTVCKDNQCALGQWIYGEGSKFNSLPEFGQLKSCHASFHKCAADIIKKADSGQSVKEEVALGSSSEFAKNSTQVVSLIMTMKSKTQKAA